MPDMPPPKPVPAVVEQVDTVESQRSSLEDLKLTSSFRTQLLEGKLKLHFDSVIQREPQEDLTGQRVGTELQLGRVTGEYRVGSPFEAAQPVTVPQKSWFVSRGGSDPFAAFVAPRVTSPLSFDRLLESAGIEAFDWQIETQRDNPSVKMRIFGEDLRHGLAYERGGLTYEIKGEPLEEWLSQFVSPHFKASGVRISHRDDQWILAPTATYDAGLFSVTASAGADELFGLTQGRTSCYHHMFSGDPQAGEGVELFGRPLTINSYTFHDSPGTLLTRIDYGSMSLLAATDPGSGRNIVGLRGAHAFDSLFGMPAIVQGQGLFHQVYGEQLGYRDGFSGQLCLVPSISNGALGLQVQGDLRRGESSNFGRGSSSIQPSETTWQVLFGLEFTR